MSLQVDTVFMAAIESDAKVMEIIGGRRWCTASQEPEDAFIKNTAVPFLIVNFDGFTSAQGTKDDDFDSGDDTVNISITIAAKNSEQLGDLAARVRRAVHNYLCAHMGEAGVPWSTIPGGGMKTYDQWKPAFFMDLTWQCNVDFDLNNDDDEQADSNSEI